MTLLTHYKLNKTAGMGARSQPEANRRADLGASTRATQAARQAGYLFIGAAIVGTVNDLLPNALGETIPQSLNLLVGVATLLFAKHRLLQGRAQLALPVFAIANVALANAIGDLPPTTYGIWFVLIFAWVGIWHSRATVLWLAPIATFAYLVPLWIERSNSLGAVPAVLIVIPVAVFSGLMTARYSQRVQTSERELQEMLSELSRTSVTDDLTGLGNRRLGDLLLENLKPGDGIALLDLDYFKTVNDKFGHPAGDRVLQELAHFLTSSLRSDDAAARMGGEEFLVVMRGVGDGVLLQTQRLVKTWSGTGPLTTFSAGVAVHRHGQDGKTTYAAADRALYLAKESGRNRVFRAA